MPSSTSSSETRQRVAPAYASRSLIGGMLLALLLVSGYEWWCRQHGYLPRIHDDVSLWCMQRDRVEHADEHTILCLGNSSMLAAMIPADFRVVCPDYELIQLAVAGVSVLPILSDLAQQTTFAGVVLCNLDMPNLLRDYDDSWCNFYYHRWSLDNLIRRRILTWYQSLVAFQHPQCSLQMMSRRLAVGTGPEFPSWCDAQRWYTFDFSQGDVAALRQRGEDSFRKQLEDQRTLEKREHLHIYTDQLQDAVSAIGARGGQVVFVRLPGSGMIEETRQEIFPRTEYWDRLAEWVQDAKFIHGRDMPGRDQFVCPDGDHLDRSSARLFSRELATELSRRGILDCGVAPQSTP